MRISTFFEKTYFFYKLKCRRLLPSALQTVDKPLDYINGCRLLLALLVLHRAKLLASNQSILALGRSPRTGRQPFVPLHLCIDSHLCRCIVQRLCAAVIMRPCIVALCGRLQASLLGLGAAAPHSAPARMPGVYAQGLCKDAKPTKHTQPFTGERGFRQGCRNKDTPSFARGKAIRVS